MFFQSTPTSSRFARSVRRAATAAKRSLASEPPPTTTSLLPPPQPHQILKLISLQMSPPRRSSWSRVRTAQADVC
ncbi:hypothetical protein L596_023268 [Steinernema carpocapsae]|uniref:Uncharacterized protein n=1 Tax=Steinernema carpocapsae TaxID=34508 RepID=A0A4U5MD56_STECR|nr:hypothetical protein L596_023268 [Steinernema carpocapsae]